MVGIVGVHGIGKYKYYLQAGRSVPGAAEAMRVKWDRYLAAGLGGDSRLSFTEVAYYAHHLNDHGKAGRVAEMRAEEERVFVEWARQLGVGESFTGALKAFTGWLLARLDTRAAAFAALFCPEVAAYLTDEARRERCRQDVAEVLRRRAPRVVVAHSLGSVVAYETLHATRTSRWTCWSPSAARSACGTWSSSACTRLRPTAGASGPRA